MRIAIILVLALSLGACDTTPFICGLNLFWHRDCNGKHF